MNGRAILAIFAGVISAGLIVWVLMTITHLIYPIDSKAMTEALRSNDLETLRQFLLNQPTGALIGVVLGHGLGLFGGLFIGHLIDRKNISTLFIIASIMILMNVINFLTVPHPSWFPFVDVGFSLLMAALFIFSRKKSK
jgi:hypothetical protein